MLGGLSPQTMVLKPVGSTPRCVLLASPVQCQHSFHGTLPESLAVRREGRDLGGRPRLAVE